MISVAQNLYHQIIELLLNWKEYGRKWSWHNISYCPSTCLKGLRKTTKASIQDSQSLGEI
jgi:hypothetical protein